MVTKGLITDPVGDLLSRVRNAVNARHREIAVPYSRLREDVARVLKREGFAEEVKKRDDELIVSLAYRRRRPLITGVKNVSRPGLRIYRKVKDLPKPLGGAGISIISTSKGIMSNKEAEKKGLGGEVLGEVW